MNILIGVDIGTTNVKAVALDDNGRPLAMAARPVRTLSPFPGAAEQQPAMLVKLVIQVIREVRDACPDAGKIAGLVFSGAMHALLAVDKKGSPLTNAWLWSDLRAADFSDALRGTEAGRNIYRNTGTPIHPMSPLVKLMWMRAHLPEIYAQTHKLLGIKDYVLKQLLGEYICDASVASASGLLNSRSGQWDTLALQTAGIRENLLPEPVSPCRVFPLPAVSADLLNLPAGLPVLPGASDGALANIGSEAGNPDTLAVTIGTSAALRLTLDQPYFDDSMRTFCYRLDDRRFIAGGASNNGSNTLDWLRQQVLRTKMPAGTLLDLAEKIPAGCDGLLFIPYLHGERAPVWNARASGIFHGITAAHGRDHFIRAALEGVVFNLKLIAESLPRTKNARRIAFSGGAAKSALWRQVLADVFQKPVVLPVGDRVDASARGAIILARTALGLPPLPVQQLVESAIPDAQNVEKYAASFQRFSQLCALKI
ncbi:MAG: gluconokinase [Thermoanaerobaculia bacterium]|nr:gluconokinase [Thermoanaerobaculia bacterium]